MTKIAKGRENSQQKWIEETFGVMSVKESEELLDDIFVSRINKEYNLKHFSKIENLELENWKVD